MAGKIVHFEVPSGDADRASAFTEGKSFSLWQADPSAA